MPSFDAVDTNRDGVISRAEYQQAGDFAIVIVLCKIGSKCAGLVYAAPGTARRNMCTGSRPFL